MNACKTCKFWCVPVDVKGKPRTWDGIVFPIDPDTYKAMDTTFDVRECKHPELMFCERPLRPDGFAVADGSDYSARLYTAEEHGCSLHEAAP